ncbi:MAG: M48 family metalloprotease [Chthonomonadales bacterium]
MKNIIPLFVIASVSLFGSSATAQFQLISESQELNAGRQADAQITQKYKVSNDSRRNRLVQSIGNRLVAVCERPKLKWTFRVLDSEELNAFSVPGFVYITTKTMDACNGDRDELAGVIGHEIGHTCGKHMVRSMEKQTVGGLLISLLGGNNKLVSGLANLAANIALKGYSRDEENDADKRSVHYTIAANYDPRGLIRFFEYLENNGDKSTNSGIGKFLQDHPATVERVKRVEAEIAKTRNLR